MRNLSIPMLGICIALLVTACAKKEAAPPQRTAPPPAAGVTLVSVDLGKSLNADKTISEKAAEFHGTDTFYASVATAGAGNASVRARWIFEDGTVIDDSMQSIAPAGPAQTEFHLSKPDAWPLGKYRVEVSLDGGPVVTKEFQVK